MAIWHWCRNDSLEWVESIRFMGFQKNIPFRNKTTIIRNHIFLNWKIILLDYSRFLSGVTHLSLAPKSISPGLAKNLKPRTWFERTERLVDPWQDELIEPLSEWFR